MKKKNHLVDSRIQYKLIRQHETLFMQQLEEWDVKRKSMMNTFSWNSLKTILLKKMLFLIAQRPHKTSSLEILTSLCNFHYLASPAVQLWRTAYYVSETLDAEIFGKNLTGSKMSVPSKFREHVNEKVHRNSDS